MAQIVPRFDFRIDFAVMEDIGKHRDSNEDAHLADPSLALFAVADGMGGHAAGEVASRLALEEVKRSVAGPRSQAAMDAYVRAPSLETRRAVIARLRRAVEHANTRVREEGRNDPSRMGMGTTVDVVWLARDHAFVAHAGDSRVYLSRPNTVMQLTQDHAEMDSLKATGVIPAHKRNRGNSRLLNAVGVADRIAVDTLFVDLGKGDRILLCSDGVHGQIDSEAELSELVRSSSVTDAAKALVARAGEHGRDNATALVIEIADRFVRRSDDDRGFRSRDLERAQMAPLFLDMPMPQVMATLTAAIEVELEAKAIVPQVVANDLVTYIVLEGLVTCEGERVVTVGALLFPESLVGVATTGELPVVTERARLLRLRYDDFTEICKADRGLSSELHRRLATHLARARQKGTGRRGVPSAPIA